MSRQLEMEAGALITIISRIQRSRRTGLLMARRLNGAEWEEGSITFVNGQVTGSELGRRKGKDAFNTMSQWKNCRFMFLSPDQSTLFTPPPKPPALYQSSPLRKPVPMSPARGENVSIWQNQNLFVAAVPVPSMVFERARPVLDRLGSRVYRQVFLLIDGQRSVAELLRLVGRDLPELEKILHELEQAGIIRLQR